MTGEGFLLLAAILIGTPLGIMLFGVGLDWWIRRRERRVRDVLAYEGLAGLRDRLIEWEEEE